MSRSGYSEDLDPLDLGRWRAQVASAIRGSRGQKLLRELAEGMDAMPDKRLVAESLVTPEGDCCAMGVVCKSRGIEEQALGIDENDPQSVGKLLNIAHQLAAEIAHENDEGSWDETPEQRWVRMRVWVAKRLVAK